MPRLFAPVNNIVCRVYEIYVTLFKIIRYVQFFFPIDKKLIPSLCGEANFDGGEKESFCIIRRVHSLLQIILRE